MKKKNQTQSIFKCKMLKYILSNNKKNKQFQNNNFYFKRIFFLFKLSKLKIVECRQNEEEKKVSINIYLKKKNPI